jgi:lipopolysaccharide export LptBFGC system permease protein LptF
VSSVALMALSLCLGVALPGFAINWDVRRWGHLYVGRAWNSASLWSSVMAFGPLAVPVHFVQTRRSMTGLALGIGCMLAIVACSALAQALLFHLISPS